MQMLKYVLVEDKKVRIGIGDELFAALKKKKAVKEQELYYSVCWDSGNKISFDSLPEDVLALPLILNLAPIIWRLGLKAKLGRVEKNFADSLDALYRSYCWLWRELPWRGKIEIEERYHIEQELSEEGISLFSLGVDSVATYLRNKDIISNFISIVGSDVKISDSDGIKKFQKEIFTVSEALGVRAIGIETNFRSMINEGRLGRQIPEEMNWWLNIQHGPALASFLLVAAHALGCGHAFIASSDPKKTLFRIGSRPDLEGILKYGKISICHDSIDIGRTEKINIISKEKWPHNLHVCWRSDGFGNCGRCEKCLRTILGFLVLGDIASIERYFDIDFNQLKEDILQLLKSDYISNWNSMSPYIDMKYFIKQENEYITNYNCNNNLLQIIKIIKKFDPYEHIFIHTEKRIEQKKRKLYIPLSKKRREIVYTPSA